LKKIIFVGIAVAAFAGQAERASAQTVTDPASQLQSIQNENSQLKKQIAALREQVRLQKEYSALKAKLGTTADVNDAANAVPGASRGQTSTSATAAVSPAAARTYAADMRAPVYKAAPSSVFNWGGCYMGGNGGWLGNDSKITTKDNDPHAADLTAALTVDHSFTNSGATVGMQGGCNWQSSQFVYGIEGDFNWSGLDRTINTAFAAIPILPSGTGSTARNESLSQNVKWFSTVRGRIGYASDTWLLYATGGLAFGEVDSSLNVVAFAPVVGIVGAWNGSTDSTRVGWTAGAGIEHAFSRNWTAKIEYLYVDLGSFTALAPFASPTATSAGWAADVNTRFNVVRLGVNYKF
jgi:outer membrane immunogenic protein